MYKLGDLIVELTSPDIAAERRRQILQDLNEFGDRDEKYRGWIGSDGRPLFSNPSIKNPVFLTNALSPMSLNLTTDTAIVTSVDTPVPFESSFELESGKCFKWDSADPTKIRLAYSGQGFGILGKVTWEGNATGYRVVKVLAYDQEDNLLGTDVLNCHAGFSLTDNVFPFELIVPQNQFPTMDYFVLTVGHTRGTDLNLLAFGVTIFIT